MINYATCSGSLRYFDLYIFTACDKSKAFYNSKNIDMLYKTFKRNICSKEERIYAETTFIHSFEHE